MIHAMGIRAFVKFIFTSCLILLKENLGPGATTGAVLGGLLGSLFDS